MQVINSTETELDGESVQRMLVLAAREMQLCVPGPP